jgi:IS4 transposase
VIHENAYWDLQTYLGLRERLAANECARSFTYESTRERTPLGHAHREQVRDLSIAETREMHRQAVSRLLSEVAETEASSEPGSSPSISPKLTPSPVIERATKTKSSARRRPPTKYAYQWATVQLVGNAVPIVLDARPVRTGESRLELVKDFLDSVEELVLVHNVLMDRELDSQHVLELLSQRGLSYVVPSGCRPVKRIRLSGYSNTGKIATRPTGNSISARTSDTRRR